MKNYIIIFTFLISGMIVACAQTRTKVPQGDSDYEVVKTPEEWKKILTPQEYNILRQSGTERAFSGDLWDHKGEGIYTCAACNQPLFASETKFKSGTGWPSYYQPIDSTAVGSTSDRSYGMVRTEVHCNRCGGHLGHVFRDGPKPTGLRYCINSASLNFTEERDKEKIELKYAEN